MNKFDADYERFEEYQYIDNSRSARRHRKGRAPDAKRLRYQQQKARRMAEIAEMSDRMADFVPTYAAHLDPRHHERQWVINSLSSFYGNDQITDVLRLVKGGKEANVYCCEANPKIGMELLAAKLYRPRMLRHLKNNAIYKEGRFLRDADGKLILGSREERAMQKKTRFGQELDLTAWIGHEFEVQRLLYEAGGDVPQPVAHGGNVILMEYIGDEALTAPTLQEVRLEPEEAQPLFEQVMFNVRLMLEHHLVHGDLSAYNILYWYGQIKIIDFPQMVDARTNRNAFPLLERDVERVVDYFTTYGVKANATTLAAEMWDEYMREG